MMYMYRSNDKPWFANQLIACESVAGFWIPVSIRRKLCQTTCRWNCSLQLPYSSRIRIMLTIWPVTSTRATVLQAEQPIAVSLSKGSPLETQNWDASPRVLSCRTARSISVKDLVERPNGFISCLVGSVLFSDREIRTRSPSSCVWPAHATSTGASL